MFHINSRCLSQEMHSNFMFLLCTGGCHWVESQALKEFCFSFNVWAQMFFFCRWKLSVAC